MVGVRKYKKKIKIELWVAVSRGELFKTIFIAEIWTLAYFLFFFPLELSRTPLILIWCFCELRLDMLNRIIADKQIICKLAYWILLLSILYFIKLFSSVQGMWNKWQHAIQILKTNPWKLIVLVYFVHIKIYFYFHIQRKRNIFKVLLMNLAII